MAPDIPVLSPLVAEWRGSVARRSVAAYYSLVVDAPPTSLPPRSRAWNPLRLIGPLVPPESRPFSYSCFPASDQTAAVAGDQRRMFPILLSASPFDC